MTRVEKELAQAHRSQMELLAFKEAKLYFLGELQRQYIAQRLYVASVQAIKDLLFYKQLAKKILDYDYRARIYQPSYKFKRIFDLSKEIVLWWLKSGLGDGLPNPPSLPKEFVNTLRIPDGDMLVQVTEAIYRRRVLGINYLSLSSGYKTRQMAPHALINNHKRWYVRAFDWENDRFSDFFINRIQFTHALDENISSNEVAAADGQCARGVDCSLDSSLNPKGYHLALPNIKSLTSAESADLSLGYKRTKGLA